MQSRTRRRLAVAILVILALTGTIVATSWTRTREQAEAPVETVRAFLEASRRGDVDAALALTDDEPSDSEELLVPEAQSDDWTIGDLNLRSWSPDADVAQVSATIIGPHEAELTTTFRLERSDDAWKVTNPFTTLPIGQVPLPYLQVNGHTIPMDPNQLGGWEFTVLPGVYHLYPNPPELLIYEGAPVIALGGTWTDAKNGDAYLTVFSGFHAAEGTEEALNEQMQTYLDDCMADADGPEQFGCPFGLDEWDIAEEGFTPGPERQWELVEYPQVVAGTLGPMFAPEQLAFLTRHEGLARVTVTDENSDEQLTLECPISTDGLYLWLDETNQYAIGPNGDPAAPNTEDTAWNGGYRSYCELP
jgi:hypothetical protein